MYVCFCGSALFCLCGYVCMHSYNINNNNDHNHNHNITLTNYYVFHSHSFYITSIPTYDDNNKGNAFNHNHGNKPVEFLRVSQPEPLHHIFHRHCAHLDTCWGSTPTLTALSLCMVYRLLSPSLSWESALFLSRINRFYLLVCLFTCVSVHVVFCLIFFSVWVCTWYQVQVVCFPLKAYFWYLSNCCVNNSTFVHLFDIPRSHVRSEYLLGCIMMILKAFRVMNKH